MEIEKRKNEERIKTLCRKRKASTQSTNLESCLQLERRNRSQLCYIATHEDRHKLFFSPDTIN
jgi:hypothetical protein